MNSIDVSVVEARKAQWSGIITTSQARAKELHDELVSLQGQIAQLSGAVQACDVLLASVNEQSEVSTLENNG